VGLVGFVLAGSGSDWSEEPVVGVGPAALDVEVAAECPLEPSLSQGVHRGPVGGTRRRTVVVSDIAVLRGRFSRGAFALVVHAAGGVVADLGDVQTAVELSIFGAGQRWRTTSPEDTSIGAVPV
jgi:hypothetical protein